MPGAIAIHSGWECCQCNVINEFEVTRDEQSRIWRDDVWEQCSGQRCAGPTVPVHYRCGECRDTDEYGMPMRYCNGNILTPSPSFSPSPDPMSEGGSGGSSQYWVSCQLKLKWTREVWVSFGTFSMYACMFDLFGVAYYTLLSISVVCFVLSSNYTNEIHLWALISFVIWHV